jgi:DUF1365 family protein
VNGSALYVGHVSHARLGATRHGFRYRIYQHLVDLDDLPALDASSRIFGWNRRRLVTFRDADHVEGATRSVREHLAAALAAHGIDAPARVRLLTHCRVLGYVFNPVSFYFCDDARGRRTAIVAEVNNTFGERHRYVLREDAAGGDGAFRTKKVFHVSPFMSLDGTYRFEIEEPGERLDIRIDLLRQGTHVFATRLLLERRPWTDGTLAGVLATHPLMPWQVTAHIHAQAFALWRKRLRYHPKPPYDPSAARGEIP